MFAQAQKLGRALMLPIAVLPVAGLLLRLGQPDLLDAAAMAQAGQTIFDHLPLLFAVGVAVGFAHENHGVAGLSGAVGYFVLIAVMKALDPPAAGAPPPMGVLGGIIAGLVAGTLYNRTRDIRLPEFLAFFGGKRFAAIATGFVCLALGFVFFVAWPPLERGIDRLGAWMIGAGATGLFVYGVLNRLLLVTGLHHILNSFVWMMFGSYAAGDKVVAGDLNRFFAGDPSAGAFMTGFFPIMMFGLPAATLAMVHAARPENRKRAGGVLISSGLTSAATGVTEPIEFSFMFHAPLLYAWHAILTGASMAIMYLLGVRLGFTFSAGAVDLALSSARAENMWLLAPVGLGFALIYYVSFRLVISALDLKTPGREAPGDEAAAAPLAEDDRAGAFVAALGGADNLVSVDACTTRLRLAVADSERIDEAALRRLGAKGVVRPAPGSVQVVLGPEADQVASAIRVAARAGSAPPTTRVTQAAPPADIDRAAWLAALGGTGNVRRLECVATSRIRIEVADTSRVDDAALERLGAAGVMRPSDNVVHVIAGPRAASIAHTLAM